MESDTKQWMEEQITLIVKAIVGKPVIRVGYEDMVVRKILREAYDKGRESVEVTR